MEAQKVKCCALVTSWNHTVLAVALMLMLMLVMMPMLMLMLMLPMPMLMPMLVLSPPMLLPSCAGGQLVAACAQPLHPTGLGQGTAARFRPGTTVPNPVCPQVPAVVPTWTPAVLPGQAPSFVPCPLSPLHPPLAGWCRARHDLDADAAAASLVVGTSGSGPSTRSRTIRGPDVPHALPDSGQ